MKDILDFFLKLIAIVFIPFFMIGYALYGFRIWCWYFVHASAIGGKWSITIPDALKIIKLKKHE